jgi:alkylated DNA repair dioxygenase AlkB
VVEPTLPRSCRLLEEYASPEESAALLAAVDAGTWRTDLKRRVQHFGWRYDYTARSVDASMYLGPLPEWAAVVADRLHAEGLTAELPDQLIVNEYQPGQGIAPHVDCVPCFGETVLSLTLGSGCVMGLTHTKREEAVALWLVPGSLLVLSGEARHDWRHGIAARKSDEVDGTRRPRGRRVSLTFRTVRPGRG